MHRIRLGNTVFEGNNSSYLFTGEENVLIDTGVSTSETRDQLADGLAEHGIGFEDVDRIFLTHFHADHSGLAGEIQRESGAAVYVHPEDEPLVRGDPDAWDDLRDRQLAYFDEWGMDPGKRDELVNYMDSGPDAYGETVDTDTFEHGDRFDVNGVELEVIHTPGHTRGLSCFAMTDRNEAFTGDALLPVYTPNVGGADVRVDRPLERYLDTLNRIADREFDRAWPGHRDPIDDPTDRAEFIIHHHEERAWRVLNVLDERGSADAWTVSADLFGELVRIHILHGPGEAYAHLEHLSRNGEIERNGKEYRLTPETKERFDARDDESWPL